MYTILVDDSNALITTVRERIIQRSKLVDNLHFLVNPTYKNFDMSQFTAVMEYVTPVSRELHTEFLTQSQELYKDMIEYKLPIDTNITKEAGIFELKLTFTYVEMDVDGKIYQHVRKTTPTGITIIPCPAWCDIVPDAALSALDQRIIGLEALVHALDDESKIIYETKADNIKYDNTSNTLQLMSNGKLIGDKVYLTGSGVGIIEIHIDKDGNLIAVYSDGRQEVVGKTGSDCAGIYIPSLEGDIMTFTLSDKATEDSISFDIDKDNNWNPIGGLESETSYIWQEI